MKKWAIPLAATAIAIVAVAGVAFALTDSSDTGNDGSRVSRDADHRDDSGEDSGAADCSSPPCDDFGDGGGLAICIEGAVDCDDTVEEPPDHVCIQIYPTPPECADPDEPVSSEPPIVDDPPSNSCNSSSSAADCEGAAVALASKDLSQRLGNPGAISVESVEFVEWPNACLGVEKAGVACAEVITPGFRILLVVNGATYEYHTGAGSRAVLVE